MEKGEANGGVEEENDAMWNADAMGSLTMGAILTLRVRDSFVNLDQDLMDAIADNHIAGEDLGADTIWLIIANIAHAFCQVSCLKWGTELVSVDFDFSPEMARPVATRQNLARS